MFQIPNGTYGKNVNEVEKASNDSDKFDSASDTSVKEEDFVEKETPSTPKVVENESESPRSMTPRRRINRPRSPAKYAEMYRANTPSPRGNKRGWNNMISQQLGSDFVFKNKACHICGSFDHLHANCNYHKGRRAVYGNTGMKENDFQGNKNTHPKGNMIPRAVLLRSGLKHFNTGRPVNTAYSNSPPKSPNRHTTTFSKPKHQKKDRKYEKRVVYTQKWVPKARTARQAVTTGRPAVTTASPKVTTAKVVNKGIVGNVVKASARWEWKPKGTTNNPNGVSMTFDRYNYIDTRGRSKSILAWVSKRN